MHGQLNRKRVAVFASFSSDGLLSPQVLPYLAGLKPLTLAIVVVCDNDLVAGEKEKLASFATHVITGRHGEYDFGSYKRGVAWMRENGFLDDADDLILCNDSCYGPVGSFEPMFTKMEARRLDFWGATDSHEFTYHLQSYWIVLSRKVFSSPVFRAFLDGVKKEENVRQVILNYELGLTRCLVEAGFKAGAMVENTLKGVHSKDPTYKNLTSFPIYMLECGLPLVKAKALRVAHTSADGQNRLLAWLRENGPDVHENATSDIDIRRFEDADNQAFSLIMPTRNRAWCISRAITSVLAQTHRNFELIIVDDGSSDGTEEIVRADFKQSILEGRVKYIRLPENIGVCNARNIGLINARNPWIGYADSDNVMRPYYLTMVANSIIQNPERDVFYGQMINVGDGGIVGKAFSRDVLLRGNFIDLGVFIHRRSLIARFGGFDVDLKRLVDWDLIIRYTAHQDPVFIPKIFLEYTDEKNADRISVKESYVSALVAVHAKHSVKPTISTAILSYNHQEYLAEAIESALAQKGDFSHEILISDDGSTDGCARIVESYAQKYPKQIRNISPKRNLGISENYKHCFREASGDFVAILEGDDYWIDVEKNLKQAAFLTSHPEAIMVFSRVEVFNMSSDHRRLLKRQDSLAPLLTGADFARNEHLNLIANFSSSMFRRDVMRNMPSAVYQPRLNEITVSFYLDRIGKIGFLDEVMSVYRQNSTSVWTGADQASQLRQAIAIRESAMRISRAIYRSTIRERLEEKKAQLAGIVARDQKANVA
ncbi:MAG: glycosyltransferase [Parvularcula sp.]|jgi:glycosyltransferase involved in cell wall biosynthesis|nr:glycosyltransferase [Parvularcula sp.]